VRVPWSKNASKNPYSPLRETCPSTLSLRNPSFSRPSSPSIPWSRSNHQRYLRFPSLRDQIPSAGGNGLPRGQIDARIHRLTMLQREHDDPRSILTDVERINEIFQGIAAHQFDPGFGSVVQRFLLVGIELKV
jgi:hypothetical protein